MPDAVPLQDMLARMLQAIELERSTVQQALGKLGDLGAVRGRDGRLLVPEPGAYLYRFRCDLDLHLPVDTPLLVMAGAESSAADVFEHDVELERLDLTLRGSLGETVPEAILHLDPSYLLTALAARLQTILDQPEQLPLPRRFAPSPTPSASGQFSRERGLALLSGVVITELILRLHILIQRYRDGETPYWSFSAKRRYLEMFLVAHSLAAGIGAIAAVATWNPMMLNFGAIIAAVKNAIHLAWRVYKERREALDRFANLAERTSGDLDELLVRATAREVSLLVA